MGKQQRNYTEEFKTEAMKLALSSGSISGAARDLGMPKATLYTWVEEAKSMGEQQHKLPNGEKTTVNVGEVLAENERLRKRLNRLEQEKAILKKAATYFAKELG